MCYAKIWHNKETDNKTVNKHHKPFSTKAAAAIPVFRLISQLNNEQHHIAALSRKIHFTIAFLQLQLTQLPS